nr:immunoglobulin heavy chain junction region [Macaca mulatta]MOV38015.1 immunoglobulin heavy chain junction region [Macaca mulatta]MOV38109.1 immunoglobulin heavy chain junction region [Macaca mulatta]MOV38515.1 immunoglobulin heavy chain junction region [Macaca mulatta]MOV38883.1 immunoglobulin heavy chain junction region [Macaca mulatta]
CVTTAGIQYGLDFW